MVTNIGNINFWVGNTQKCQFLCIRDEGDVKYDIDDHFWDFPATILTKASRN